MSRIEDIQKRLSDDQGWSGEQEFAYPIPPNKFAILPLGQLVEICGDDITAKGYEAVLPQFVQYRKYAELIGQDERRAEAARALGQEILSRVMARRGNA
ncbi:hypothetical protein GII36_05380 [Candidatus Mycosynbacter amalyticus]|uniref:Uncharacterized protein n=1 Tax=Candidatus Mycosynbacter amalyticus TaxID=2665156 RepID=A0A857MPS2_9BACT|nr:hypothetical protein [Candidatus Mycosynbacter amalyticus]QHN43249.1 hypothetical protein GII36_05380 [Candidatus Mycosynbacter amalyticus]